MKGSFVEKGGLWVLCQSVAMMSVIILGVVYRSSGTPWEIMLVGGTLLSLGGVVGIWGVIDLGKARTAFPKPKAETQLIRHGIYGRIRHPLYTSVILVSFGWSLVWQSGPAFVLSVFLLPFFDLKARREERWLTQQFPEYPDYQQRVRRFFPWIY